jgi:phage gp36-like protein
MPYSTIEDIQMLIGAAELARLTDSEPPDEDKIQTAINQADSLIDAYTYGRCIIDAENIPPFINKISCDLTSVILSENYYRFNELPNATIRLKRQSISILEDIAKGKLLVNFENLPTTIQIITNKLKNHEVENE